MKNRVVDKNNLGGFIMPELNTGEWAKTVRIARRLSQSDLATKCGVSSRDVYLFEKNEPVRMEVKLRLLQELWANRAS